MVIIAKLKGVIMFYMYRLNDIEILIIGSIHINHYSYTVMGIIGKHKPGLLSFTTYFAQVRAGSKL